MAVRDWATGYQHFRQAHDLGHPVRGRHLTAHRAALKAARRARHPGRVLYQLVFLGFASITSRDGKPHQ